MSVPASPLPMTDGQREVLESLVRSRTSEFRVVQRAQVLLLAADGVSNVEVAERCEVSRPTVLAWRAQFEAEGLVKFGQVAKGRGRKATIPAEKIAEIVELTLHHKPDGETHWSCRTMAKRAGVSSAAVQRIWSARGLKPHLVNTFKLSTDPRFEEKLIDVVGLYLNPPDKAVVLCMDEKSQIQALGPPPPQRLPALPTHHRHLGAARPGHPDDVQQLRHPQPSRRPGLAGQAPPLPPALHPNLVLLAQPGRTLLRQHHRQSHPPRRLPQRPRPDSRDRGLPPRAQRQPETIPLDRHRRTD